MPTEPSSPPLFSSEARSGRVEDFDLREPQRIQRAAQRAFLVRLHVVFTGLVLVVMFVHLVTRHLREFADVSVADEQLLVVVAWLVSFGAALLRVDRRISGRTLLAVSTGLACLAWDSRLAPPITPDTLALTIFTVGLAWVAWAVWATLPVPDAARLSPRDALVGATALALLFTAWILLPPTLGFGN